MFYAHNRNRNCCHRRSIGRHSIGAKALRLRKLTEESGNLAFGAGQNDLRAADDAVGEVAGIGEGQQLGFVVFAEGNRGESSAAGHKRSPVSEDAPYYITYLWDNILVHICQPSYTQ